MTVDQAMSFFGVLSRDTVISWIRRGVISARKIERRKILPNGHRHTLSIWDIDESSAQSWREVRGRRQMQKPPVDPEPVHGLTISEVASMLCVTDAAVINAMRRGRIRVAATRGHRRYLCPESVEQYRRERDLIGKRGTGRHVVTVIRPEDFSLMNDVCARTGMTVSTFVRAAIKQALEAAS